MEIVLYQAICISGVANRLDGDPVDIQLENGSVEVEDLMAQIGVDELIRYTGALTCSIQ